MRERMEDGKGLGGKLKRNERNSYPESSCILAESQFPRRDYSRKEIKKCASYEVAE